MKRLSTEKRNELGKVIPLEQPYVLLIDPSNICNLRCVFCPTGYDNLIKESNRNNKIMDFALYKKVIDDLKEFKYPLKVLRLYKEGEPLVNPNFSKMISYAKKSSNVLRIDTTTNGVLLNKELNRRIIDAGIDQINISVNGLSSNQIYKYTNKKVDFEKYVENIRDLYEHKGQCEIYIKAIKDYLTNDEQKKFYDIFGEISDRIYLERLSPAWPDFNIKNKNFCIGNYGQKVEMRKVCPYIFYILVVNSDGTASTCVGDWKHKQILGNVSKESIMDIWRGNEIKKYWIEHLKFNKNIFPMCSKCKVIEYGAFDNVDMYSSEIYERLTKNIYNYK